jgi:acetyl-CoA acetyltransferase
MVITAENLAEKYNITREDVDKFALRSQLNWKAALENGNFTGEVKLFIVHSINKYLLTCIFGNQKEILWPLARLVRRKL